MENAKSSLKIRFLILLLIAGMLLALAPVPNDTTAIAAFATYSPLKSGTPGDPLALSLPSHHDMEAALRSAISRRPRDPQPWRLLGDLFVQWRRPDDALYAYGQAIRRGDDEAVMDQSLARLYAILKDDRQAHTHWVNYVDRRPLDREARLVLAWTNVNLADWELAIAELERLRT